MHILKKLKRRYRYILLITLTFPGIQSEQSVQQGGVMVLGAPPHLPTNVGMVDRLLKAMSLWCINGPLFLLLGDANVLLGVAWGPDCAAELRAWWWGGLTSQPASLRLRVCPIIGSNQSNAPQSFNLSFTNYVSHICLSLYIQSFEACSTSRHYSVKRKLG